MTYHWNDGRGTRAGTIALRDANGRTYGPWSVPGAPGQRGVPDADWTCAPNIEIPAGTYTIIDSEAATWSQNAQSGGRGMAVVKGYPIDSTTTPTTPSPAPRPTPQPTAQSRDAEQREIASKRSQASRLFTEGDACEQKGDLNCAITKYEAAAAVLPNQQVSEKITQLRAVLAQNQAAVTVRVPATGAWVLEKTEFVVEKVDPELMRKWRLSESGRDGAGSAQSTFGHPDPKVNTVIVKMAVAWTSPPRVLVPGKPIDFRITVSDAGSDDPRGLGVGGVGSLAANCPALSAVWYGPSANFNLKLDERSKEASKAYTPPKAAPGATMYIVAEYGVFTRRNQFFYIYKFTVGAEKEPAPVR